MNVIPCKKKGYTERAKSTVLSVGLFVIANMFDEVLDGDRFLVLVGVTTGTETCLVDEDVGIGGETSDGACCVGAKFVGFFGCLCSVNVGKPRQKI